jgi:hypothetical protein
MSKLFFALLLAFILTPLAANAQHEYAPIEEKTVNYKNWTLPGLADRKLVNLRTWAQDKKLVIVVYFAPWCGNWKFNYPVISKLYEKYKAQGLGVVGVSEYGSLEESRNYFGPSGPPFPVVSESETRDDRTATTHYGYRQLTGDGRNWGSPWHIFLEPAKLNAKGDVLAEKAFIVNGELIEAEADKFIAQKLGEQRLLLPAVQKVRGSFSANPTQTQDKPTLNLKAKDEKDKGIQPCTDKP